MTYQTISDTQKVDYLFKKLGWGVAKTDQNQTGGKDAYQEAIPSPLLIRGDKIWTQAVDIPAIIPAGNSSVVAIYNDSITSTVECTEDSNDVLNVTWLTNLSNWIPVEFGSTYLVKAYIAPTGTPNPQTTGIPIYSQGSGNNDQWFFDYQAGVLNFSGANLPTYSNSTPIDFSGKSVFISGARYTGTLGVSSFVHGATFGNITIAGNTITGNSNITFGGNITAGNIIATGEFYGKFSGLIETGAQPDITSLGNLGNLTVNTYILGNTITSNTLTVNGNANVGNILTNGFYYPNGTPWVFYSNANVAAYLPTYNGNIGGNIGINGNLTVYSGTIFAPTANVNQVNAGNIAVTNNVQMGNLLTNAFFWGNGVPIVFSNYGNANVGAYFANVINNNTFYGNILADTITPFRTNVTVFNSNTAVGMPRGNTATRPTGSISGYTRFNTDTESLEFFNGTMWTSVTSNITDQSIIGDGVNFVFDLTEPASPIGILVSINGVIQVPNQAYTTTPNRIIFAQIPNSTDVIDIRFLGSMSYLNSTVADDLYVTGNLHVSGNILSNLLVYSYGNAQVTTYLNNFPGNIIPFSNNNFNLGSQVESWQTLYLGGLPITVSNNNLVLNGNIVSGNYGNANVAVYLAGGNDPTISTINTNITGTNQAIVTANAAIVNLVTSIVTNANANTAAYLTTATGNIKAGNISTIGNISANGVITSVGNISTISSVVALTMQTTGPSGNIRGVNVLNANSVSISNGIFWAGNGASYSSGSGGGSSYSNTDVANYLASGTDATVSAITANLGAFKTYANATLASTNANLAAFETYANATLASTNANLAAFETYANLTFGTSNYANANVASYLAANTDPTIQSLNANTSQQAAQINSINANARSFYTYANATFGTSSYSNANVVAYLTSATITTTGNITAGNLTTLGTYTVAGITTTGAYGNITGANVITANTIQATNYQYANGVSILTGITANGYGNIYGTTSNVTLVAGTYSYVFDTTGNVTLPTNGDLVMPGSGANLIVGGSISVGGTVSMPNRPAFRVYGAGTTTALSTTQNTNGILNSNNWAVDFQQGTALSASTGLFTAPVAGLYQVNLTARTNANNNNAYEQIEVRKNTGGTITNVICLEWPINAGMNHTGGSTIVKLAVGDTLYVQVTNGTVNFDGNDNWSVAYIG